MLSITKEFTFDAAHQLIDYDGPCSRLHGHTYKLQVSVCRGEEDGLVNDDGMVMDFSRLKEIVHEKVISQWDHTNLNEQLSGVNPTAENMVRIIVVLLGVTLLEERIILNRVRLWETPTSFVEWNVSP